MRFYIWYQGEEERAFIIRPIEATSPTDAATDVLRFFALTDNDPPRTRVIVTSEGPDMPTFLGGVTPIMGVEGRLYNAQLLFSSEEMISMREKFRIRKREQEVVIQKATLASMRERLPDEDIPNILAGSQIVAKYGEDVEAEIMAKVPQFNLKDGVKEPAWVDYDIAPAYLRKIEEI